MDHLKGFPVSDKHNPDIGKQIGDTVRTALESGDLSRLKDIGPVVQSAVKDSVSNGMQNWDNSQKNKQAPPAQTKTGNSAPHPYAPNTPSKQRQQAQQAWQQNRQQTPTWQAQQQRDMRRDLQTQGWYSSNGALRPTMPKSGYGVGSVVLGIMGMVAFGLAAITLGLAGLAIGAAGGMLYAAAAMVAPFLLSTGLFSGGIGRRGLVKRLRRDMMLFGDKDVLTIEEISKATNRSEAAVKRDLQKGIDKKILRGIRMDVMETCIIRGDDAYQLYVETEEARKQREAEEAERARRMQNPETAPIEVFRQEGRETIRKIRQANMAIPEPEISEKLEKLENTTGRIFSYVEQHPEKLPDTRKFMSYYLPTTLKLVEKYRQYNEMDVQMENVQQAKRDISSSLDTIDLAFNNLLESLYHEDTLDVTTDIEVLETMLEQEGLTGKKFDIESDH